MKHALVCLLLVASSARAEKRAFGIEDLYRVKSASDLNVTPDGEALIYVVTTSDLGRAKRTSHIWMSDSDGRHARQLTFGEKSESSPILSPDGKTLAFVASRSGSPNLWLLPLEGGEARQLTSVSTGVSEPVWSPDGKLIAFSSDVYPECGADDPCNQKIADAWSDGPLKAHLADSLLYRHWTAWKDGQRTHVFVADAETGAVRDMTPGDFDSPIFSLGGPRNFAFSPDSKELCFASNHDPKPASSTNADLFVVSLDDKASAARNITSANKAWDGGPRYSPDGKTLAYRTQTQPGYEADLFRIALYDRATGASKIVTESYRDWVDEIAWSADSKTIWFTGPVKGANPILRFDVASGGITTVLEDRTIDEWVVGAGAVFYTRRGIDAPSEVRRASLKGGRSVQLTHLNDAVAAEVDLRPAESLWVEGAGGAKVHVFIVKPHGFDPAKKYPLILNVHGGPQGMWADSFRGDWQVYPGVGYVVAFANPHGSVGYGQEYTAQISGDWGGAVFDDLMKVTDALEKLPYVDTARMGAMGWSFGGYMMNWFLGHTTRFKALASMMGLYDLRSFYGATEELWFPEWDLKGTPWESELYRKHSPSTYVTDFQTPCLVVSGERDYRVPYTQSLSLFTELQKRGVPSRLLLFSEAGHWPSWVEMALYYTAHVEWFHEWLGGEKAPWTTQDLLRNAVFDKKTGQRVKK